MAKYKQFLTVILIISVTSFTCACSKKSSANSQGTATENNTSTVNSTLDSQYFSDEDVDSYYDSATASKITLNGDSAEGENVTIIGSSVVISSSGVYEISGTLNNGQIIVEANDTGLVRLVLNNANINCNENAPIWIKQADKTIITIPEGTENYLSDSGTYVDDGETPSAAMFSEDDLVINGSGILNINAGINDGITGKDSLKIVSAIINIASKDDGIVGKDLLAIAMADITIDALEGTGLKASNDTDEGQGIIYIHSGFYEINGGNDGLNAISLLEIIDGEFLINVSDDGIHCDGELLINYGDINIENSYEGIEAQFMTINDGNITIVSQDDGINVAGVSSVSSSVNSVGTSERLLTINGGFITVNSEGDGIDVNGSCVINDGTVVVLGPSTNGNAALDYDRTFEINGGLLIASGPSSMSVSSSSSSTQPSVSIYFNSIKSLGTAVEILDSNKNAVETFTVEKDFQNLIVSSSSFELNSEYTLVIDGQELTNFTFSEMNISINENGENVGNVTMGGKGNKGQNNQNEIPNTTDSVQQAPPTDSMMPPDNSQTPPETGTIPNAGDMPENAELGTVPQGGPGGGGRGNGMGTPPDGAMPEGAMPEGNPPEIP